MDLTSITDPCLNDSFRTLEFGLSRVGLKLSLILRKCCNLFRANPVVSFKRQTVEPLLAEINLMISKRVVSVA